MRQTQTLALWFATDQLRAWVHDAPDKTAYQRRLAIWLTHAGPFPADRVADLLQVPTRAVWKWIREYNALGPSEVDHKWRDTGLGWLITPEDEQAFVDAHQHLAKAGEFCPPPGRFIPRLRTGSNKSLH